MAAVKTRRPSSRKALRPFTVEHFRRWARGLILDSGEPWNVEPFQLAFVADLFTGVPVAWLVVPEGNGKTTLAAGLALYHIQHTVSGYVPVAASSRDQAEWVYRQAAGFVARSGLEHEVVCLEGYRRIRCDAMDSRIQVFAADDRSGDGVIPTLACLDELHRHRDLALYRTWLGKLDKRGGQLLAISTSGEVGSEFEAERLRLRESGHVTRRGCHVRIEVPGVAVMHEWSVPPGADVEDLEIVKAANPCRRITIESLRRKRSLPGMTVEHWSRFTCNRPVRAQTSAIQEREWDARAWPDPIPEGEAVWAGLDVAWQWDTTALVPLWWGAELRLLGEATVLEPPRDGTSLDPARIEQALLDLHRRNPIHTLVMDVHRAEQLAAWTEAELGCRVIAWRQRNAQKAVDFERFMEGLRHGLLRHTGGARLRAHALNAVARMLPGGQVRFDRARPPRGAVVADRRVIDALDAAAMVYSAAVALANEPPAERTWGPA